MLNLLVEAIAIAIANAIITTIMRLVNNHHHLARFRTSNHFPAGEESMESKREERKRS